MRRILAILAAGAAALRAQPTSKPDAPLIRISVDLVQVDAVVTDSKGNRVADLRPEDFELRQDGKVRDVTAFSYVGEGLATSPDAKGQPLTTLRERSKPPKRTIAIVVDDLALSFEGCDSARSALRKFIENGTQPDDLVAIIRTSGGAGALQQFTSNKSLLNAAVKQIRFSFLNRVGINSFTPIVDDRDNRAVYSDRSRSSPVLRAETRSTAAIRNDELAKANQDRLRQTAVDYFRTGTLGALQYILRGMSELPGRKSVVLITENLTMYSREKDAHVFVDRFRRIIDEANRSATVIYTVDPRGVVFAGYTAQDDIHDDPRRDPGERLLQTIANRHTEFIDSQAGLAYLAHQTGGLFLRGNNDLGHQLERAAGDQSSYYLIGYRPDDGTFEDLKPAKYHRVTVGMKRAGLHVRSRGGFIGRTDEQVAERPKSAAEQVAAALVSPFRASDIPVRLSCWFDDDLKSGPTVFSLMHIGAGMLHFTDEADGNHRADIEVITTTFGADGLVADRADKRYSIRLKGPAYDDVRRRGFVYSVSTPVRKAGAFQFRAVVRDPATSLLGSASQFIEVPDVGRGALALSGVVASSANPNNSVEEYDEGHAAIRRFHYGQKIAYSYKVINATIPSGGGLPRLETMMRLYRDGVLVYAGEPTPLSANGATDLKHLRVGGVLQLAAHFLTGDYTLEIAVTDRLAKPGRNLATQRIDFELTL